MDGPPGTDLGMLRAGAFAEESLELQGGGRLTRSGSSSCHTGLQDALGADGNEIRGHAGPSVKEAASVIHRGGSKARILTQCLRQKTGAGQGPHPYQS